MLDAARRILRIAIRRAWWWERRRRRGPAQVTACRLLLEVAHADGNVMEQERRCIESGLQDQFGLSAVKVQRLVTATIRSEAPDLCEVTSCLATRYSVAQKMVLRRMLCDVARSDGSFTAEEDYLIRKISSLLRLDPGP